MVEEVAGGTTSTAHTAVDIRLLKQCGQNSVAFSVMALSFCRHHRLIAIMALAPAPLVEADGQQSKVCRSTQKTSEFLIDFVHQGFMATCYKVYQQLSSADVLAEIRFTDRVVHADKDDLLQYIVEEDDFAKIFGDLVLSLIVEEWRRFLYLVAG